MSKIIHFRLVETGDKFLIQRKIFFGWFYKMYHSGYQTSSACEYNTVGQCIEKVFSDSRYNRDRIILVRHPNLQLIFNNK